MRVLVTGDHGYIGAVLVPMLVAEGYEVTGLDADFFGGGAGTAPGRPGGGRRAADVRDVEERDLEGIDAVVHLAALSNDPLGNLDPRLTYDINHHSSVRLARLAKAAGVKRFVFSSSCSNYGAAAGELMTEESPLAPVTAYGKSKVMTEEALHALADERFSPVSLRNATAYGGSPRLRCDLVVNNLAAWAFTTGRAVIKSDGTPWRPLVHVEDIGRAFLAVLDAPRPAIHDEVFNIGRDGENYQVRDVAELVARAVPGSAVEYAPHGAPDLRDYRVSFAKARRALPAFAPRWTVPDGIAELLELYARIALKAEEIDGAKYSRIAAIGALMKSGALDASLRRTAG